MSERICRWSSRPEQEEFREEMHAHAIKSCKTASVIVLVVFAVMAALSVVFGWKKSPGVVAAVMVIMFLVFAAATVSAWVKTITGLKKPPAEGEVVKCKKWYVRRTKRHSSRTRYLIVIKTDAGKKIKVRDLIASRYYDIVEEGDRVRYHGGFSYPIELFEKRKDAGNVCVFCGSLNKYDADKCEKCKKPMLI